MATATQGAGARTMGAAAVVAAQVDQGTTQGARVQATEGGRALGRALAVVEAVTVTALTPCPAFVWRTSVGGPQ